MERELLTLKQIEIVRAVMVAGSIASAARLLNISQPGVSRAMKHIESKLDVRLFDRLAGRYVPAPEAATLFAQIQKIHASVASLQEAIDRLERGEEAELRIGSVPSIAQSMMPRAVANVQKRHPSLKMNIEILKIEEAMDYLLVGRGECVAMSYRLDHPSVRFEPLATGHLVCLAPRDHPFADRRSVTIREIAAERLIGIDPTDPYGRIMATLFERQNLTYEVSVKARFGSTVAALVAEGLGVAVLDIFTVAKLDRDRWTIRSIEDDTHFETFIASREGTVLSSFGKRFVRELRAEMQRTALSDTRDHNRIA